MRKEEREVGESYGIRQGNSSKSQGILKKGGYVSSKAAGDEQTPKGLNWKPSQPFIRSP